MREEGAAAEEVGAASGCMLVGAEVCGREQGPEPCAAKQAAASSTVDVGTLPMEPCLLVKGGM